MEKLIVGIVKKTSICHKIDCTSTCGLRYLPQLSISQIFAHRPATQNSLCGGKGMQQAEGHFAYSSRESVKWLVKKEEQIFNKSAI